MNSVAKPVIMSSPSLFKDSQQTRYQSSKNRLFIYIISFSVVFVNILEQNRIILYKSEPPDDIKVAIAQYFDVSVDYLLGIIDSPVPIERKELIIRLPAKFPERLLPEVKNYIKYLVYREKAWDDF